VAGGLLLLAGTGCATNSAPNDFLPVPVESQQESYGGWIELEVDAGKKETRRVEGELLVVTASEVWVAADSGVVVVAAARVKDGKLTAYRSNSGAIAGGTLLGTLSTVSNGILLVFTAPLWLITGSVAAGAESQAPVKDVTPLKWPELAAWARFPQGVPEGVDVQRLRPNPAQRQGGDARHADPVSPASRRPR